MGCTVPHFGGHGFLSLTWKRKLQIPHTVRLRSHGIRLSTWTQPHVEVIVRISQKLSLSSRKS